MVIFIHRYPDSNSIWKLVNSWLLVDPSEHYYTAHSSKFNNLIFNLTSKNLDNVIGIAGYSSKTMHRVCKVVSSQNIDFYMFMCV